MKKTLKWLLIGVLVIIACVSFSVGKKVMILSKLDNSVRNLEDTKDNIYIKIVNTVDSETESTVEMFVRDNVEKVSKIQNDKNKSVIQITYPTERKVFTEDADKKTFYKEENIASKRTSDMFVSDSHTVIVNFARNDSFIERILTALNTKIIITRIDDKDCYGLSGTKSPIFVYRENSTGVSAFVEKDTGLPVKLVETIDKNGEKVEYTTTYQVQFDCVTNEDMVEPNELEYEPLQ